jgi:hypothetical protein
LHLLNGREETAAAPAAAPRERVGATP